MSLARVKEFLDGQRVRYVAISHAPAYTAQEVAAFAHVPGKELAKTVMVRIDGEMAMAVLPASLQVDCRLLATAAGARSVEIAREEDFERLFPDCEVGAMPPFGNLYGMAVFVEERLAEDAEIAFNAGTHAELVRLAYRDFARLVDPRVARFSKQDPRDCLDDR